MNNELKKRLSSAASLKEVQDIVQGHPELDSNRLWEEVQRHRHKDGEKLDLDELDAVSGGANRDYAKEGCAATVEVGSWCWSNDHCMYWDVTYVNLWSVCPDLKPHEFVNGKCRRCGITEETANSTYYPR